MGAWGPKMADGVRPQIFFDSSTLSMRKVDDKEVKQGETEGEGEE